MRARARRLRCSRPSARARLAPRREDGWRSAGESSAAALFVGLESSGAGIDSGHGWVTSGAILAQGNADASFASERLFVRATAAAHASRRDRPGRSERGTWTTPTAEIAGHRDRAPPKLDPGTWRGASLLQLETRTSRIALWKTTSTGMLAVPRSGERR